MSGDNFSSASYDHFIHVSPYHDVPVSAGYRHRVVIGPVPDQRQRTHPPRLPVAGVVGNWRQWQQYVEVPLHPPPDGLRVAPERGVHPLQATPLQATPLQVVIQGTEALERRYVGTRKLRRT